MRLPENVDLEFLLERLRELSWGAADILMSYARGLQPPYGFSKALEIQDGGDGPVSAADLAVNQWLLDGLRLNFPKTDWELLSEETSKDQLSNGAPLESEWLWILDPLDGTKDFLQGSGQYAVHLALIRRQSAVLGVVLIPEKDELWFGVEGKGAWCEDRNKKRANVMFSERNQIDDLILVASRNHRDNRLEELIKRLEFGCTSSVGSVGCKVASILRGESDVYISLSGKSAPKDWDMAAPEALLCAAGGSFTHADGAPLLYNTGNSLQNGCLIASNGNIHKDICKKAMREIALIDPKFVV